MPRIGMNPLREQAFKPQHIPPNVPVMCSIVNLPNLTGYHKNRLEIVQASLESLKRFAGVPFWNVVWDNGSMPLIGEWVQDEIKPHLYIKSQNIGKVNAIHHVLSMFHGSIVGFSDDDMLFYPNWMEPQLQILRTFTDVGIVSGCTTLRLGYNAIGNTRDKLINSGYEWDESPINDKWDRQHIASIGEQLPPQGAALVGKAGFRVKYRGITAWAGGGHCQFMGFASRLLPYFPIADRYMKPLYPVDMSIDSDGWIRLMTNERGCRHLGNVLSEDDRLEIEALL